MFATLNHRRDRNEPSLWDSSRSRDDSFVMTRIHPPLRLPLSLLFRPISVFSISPRFTMITWSRFILLISEEREREERLCREQKKVIPFSSEGNLIKVDFDGLGEEVENRFNGYSLILHGSVNCFIGCSLFPLWSCLFARPTDTLDFVAFYTVVKLATAAKVAPPCTMLASTLQVKQKLSSSYWIILRTFDYLWGGPKEILVPILRRFKTPDLDLYSSQNQPVKTSFFLHESWPEEI